MDWPIVAMAAVYFAWSAVVMWRQHSTIARQGEMLSARSYGEFAAGQVKMATPKKEPAEFDPGFGS